MVTGPEQLAKPTLPGGRPDPLLEIKGKRLPSHGVRHQGPQPSGVRALLPMCGLMPLSADPVRDDPWKLKQAPLPPCRRTESG